MQTKNYKHNITSIVTAGFPFAAYKFLMGSVLFIVSPHYFKVAGVFFWALSLLDIIINLFNMVSLFMYQSPYFDVCFFAYLFNNYKNKSDDETEIWYQIGTSFDAFISFIIVSLFVCCNLFRFLGNTEIIVWNTATVLNVVSAGFFQLRNTVRKAGKPNGP